MRVRSGLLALACVLGLATSAAAQSIYGARVIVTGAAAGSDAIWTLVAGDAGKRVVVNANGIVEWGDGTNAVDTNVYRSAANTLKTDDAFWSTGYLGVTGTAPYVIMYESDADADEKYWHFIASSGNWYLQAAEDDYGSTDTVFQATRTGVGVTALNVGATTSPDTHWSYDLGLDATRWRTLYAAELNVWQLTAKTITASIGGEIWTSETTKLTAALGSEAGDTTITVNDNNLGDDDDPDEYIVLKSATNIEVMLVTSAPGGDAGAYTYTVTRDLDTSGRNAWPAGTAVILIGTTTLGDGLITQYAVDTPLIAGEAGPTIVGLVRTGADWDDLEPRWAIGRLTGLYGYATDAYGFAAGDPDLAWVKVDAANGVRLGHGVTTNVEIQADGDASFSGSVTATSGTIGGFTIGATELYAGTGATRVEMQSNGGFWAGATAVGDAPFSVTVAGVLKAISGTIGGFTLAANTLSSGTDADYVGMSSAGTNAFWAGDSTFADAPFSVTAAGALTASDATITGTFTTDSLTIDGTDGILFDEAAGGDDYASQVRWSDGSFIAARNDLSALHLQGPSTATINLYAAEVGLWAVADHGLYLTEDELVPETNNDLGLGTSDKKWADLWVYGIANIGGGISAAGDAGATDAALGACDAGIYSLEVHFGIVIGATCVTAPSPLAQQVTWLSQELATLRAELAALQMGGQ
ncbi:MAG: hypothetical protein PHR30_16500 [Gallionellaceae bacterium]|nr:hypothetical protein [Gallionellaceae bacterium]